MILFWVSDENSGDSTLSLVFAKLCLHRRLSSPLCCPAREQAECAPGAGRSHSPES